MESINEDFFISPNFISYESTKKIIRQMERYICKLKSGETTGTGFFCLIPFPDMNNPLKVFITANHIIGEDLLNEKNGKISFKIWEESEKTILNLNNRMKYTNKEYDITIIEIKEEDNISNFLELDDLILSDLLENRNRNGDFEDKTLYITQYPSGNLSVSYGIFYDALLDKKYIFRHKCSTYNGTSGSPIFNEKSNKVIGVHLRSCGDKKYKEGSFLNYSIKEFIEKNYKNYNEKENDNINNNENDNKTKDKKNESTILSENEQKEKLKQFNKKYNTKVKKNAELIDLNTKNIGNDGLEKLCEIEFKELSNLQLFKNNISDIKPLKDAKFDKLEKLVLSYNSISDISALEKVNFLKLKELNLRHNNISDINVLKNVLLSNLEKLFLGNNNISNIEALEQADFEKLKELILNNNQIINIDALENVEFPKLKKLNLEGNKIQDVNVLQKVDFKELNELNFFNNKISDINVFNQCKFNKLRILYVNSNPLDIAKNLFIIGKLKKIKGLNFIGNFENK